MTVLQRLTISLLFISSATRHAITYAQERDVWPEGELNCMQKYRQFEPLTQKQTYYVGVHATSGVEKAYQQFNLTFEAYLSEVVGQRWNPPIEFKMVATEEPLHDWVDLKQEIDFMYTDTGVYSCLGIEIGAQSLATTVAKLKARGRYYEIDSLAGSMVTLANNKAINSVGDLEGKIIAAHTFSDFASAQSLFYVMQKSGLHHVTDPKQVIFTGSDEETVTGVLDGRWEVGFVRTGSIERTIDQSTNEIVDANLLKVLDPKIHIMEDGEVFPFLHTTPLFPEWPVAAKTSVDLIVAEEVANAMIAMRYHGSVGKKLQKCLDDASSEQERAHCRSMPLEDVDPDTRCDTTWDLAMLAYQAEVAGYHNGFRAPKSYFYVRTMQQEAGFIIKTEKNEKWHCERNADLYEGIICPEGHYKLAEEEFKTHCDDAGLPCAEAHSCYCNPCIKAYEVNLYPYFIEGHEYEDGEVHDRVGSELGCSKMSLCGSVEQDKEITYHIYDNLQREDPTVTAFAQLGEFSRDLPVKKTAPFTYEFKFSKHEPGVAILEVFFDGVNIPESPVQVQVQNPDCEELYPGEDRVVDVSGDCICPLGTMVIAGRCISDNAHEVGIHPWTIDGEMVPLNVTLQSGCDKMDICAEVKQTKEIRFRAHDNQQRQDATLEALIHIGDLEWYLPITKIDTNVYEFGFSHSQKGVAILEIFVDGVQIPDSPIRVDIEYRDCEADFPRQRMTPTPNGLCKCSGKTMKIGDECFPISIFSGVGAGVGIFLAFSLAYCFLGYRRRKNDEVWRVNAEELELSHPVEVIGQGAFGVVLAAEYRGTKVAIKRVIPKKQEDLKRRSSTSHSNRQTQSPPGGGLNSTSVGGTNSSGNLQLQESDQEVGRGSGGTGSVTNSPDTGSDSNLSDIFGGYSVGQKKTLLQKMFPSLYSSEESRMNLSLLGTASEGTASKLGFAGCLPRFCDETARRREEFKIEMRLLSRLRHPCITTVMGAVMAGNEPMMVMEFMENGSLYDLLRNETMYTGGEIIMQIVRDIAQGLRFLHASKPPILHRDLKAKNILIDSRFRAKVADFGLSNDKKKKGLHGTPFWMAPEYLKGKSQYNASCDIYSFGMIIYEIYSRKIPYGGEHPRKVLRKVCDPRINYRPTVPETCPKRMADIMTKCWSRNDSFRPQAKDLDMVFGEMTIQDAEPLIEKGNKRIRTEVAAGDMLYKVFPKKVADQLKMGQKVEPETHENVTVFFSDIVRFTDISRAMSAVKVCNMLDRLYLAFDALASKHEVFKLETIGDAWVGVTNLEGNQDLTHAKRIAEFAVDAVEAANNIWIDEENPEAGSVHIRVGFHSGPVVSNVIGSLNPRYGLFGDTMNTAARMEGLSTSDGIQCSEASAIILKEQAPDFPIRKRGKIQVKGKGQMLTYWVGKMPASIHRSKQAFDKKPVVDFQTYDGHEGKKSRKIRERRKPQRTKMTGEVEPVSSEDEFDPSNSEPMLYFSRKKSSEFEKMNRRPSGSSTFSQ